MRSRRPRAVWSSACSTPRTGSSTCSTATPTPSRARAYAVGLAGVYLNVRGREARGIVAPGEEAAQLKREIAAKLEQLRDPESDRCVVADAVDVAARYRGPYLDQSPDLVVGYAD